MKRVSAILALLSLGAISSQASILISEDFSYADGSLVPNGGWANHSGTAGDMQVSGGQVLVQHGTPSEDANVAFSSVSGKVYFGIDFSVNDLGSPYAGTDNEYFAHFKAGATDFSARLDIVAPTGAGDFTVGIASDETTADAIWGSDLTFGTTYRAVVGYDQDLNIAQLWLDPSLITDTSILGEDRPNPGDTVLQFALRQSDSSENEGILVDNLMVATTFGEAATFMPIPEPSSLLLLGLGGGFLAARRRRRS